MKPILAVLVLTVAASLDVGAQDVRSKVGPTSGTSLSNVLDPDKSIYGVQWGSSEDEFISKFGNPTGYIKLNGSDTAMLYGKSHAFIFTASKLSGLRINMTLLDWKLSQAILTLTPFDGIRWQLSNGIRREMNLAEVKKIVGDKLRDDHPGRYQLYFNSDNARIEIDFSHSTTEGDRDESYKVWGIYIRQASSASSALRKAPVPASKPLEAPVLRAAQPTARTKPAGDSDTRRPAFVEKARASMVAITGEDSAGQPITLGTGFFIGENLIATSIVGNSARRVHVRVAGQEPQTLEVASCDSYREATILSLNKTQTATSQAPPLLLGDSDEVVARDKVYFAVEAGTQSSVSEGTIKDTSDLKDKRSSLEISARITSSSKGGGPLFNREGEVIGILGQSLEGQNRFNAIPVSFLKTLLQYRSVGTSAGAGGSGVGMRAVSGDAGADKPVDAGPGQGRGAGGGNPQPERTSPAEASIDTKPKLINYVPVRFTEEARKNKTQGVVNMSILVGEDGEVKDARITKGLPDGLNEQALAAANQMRFKPATRNGNAVSYWLAIAAEFHLR